MSFPATIWIAVGHFDYGYEGQHAEWTPVASFTSEADARAFVQTENDAVQAEMLIVDQIACVDDYGYPVTRREWADLYPERVVFNAHAA